MKLSEMKELLAARQWRLTKSLGQNFMHDHNQLRRIVAAAEIGAGDKVLEVGPGLGPLTELLAEKAGTVLAIEKDARLAGFLQERFAGRANVEIVHDDAMDYLRRRRDWGDWKLAANLPYSVASAILVELAGADAAPSRMAATLQLEVAQRIAAAPGTAQYGLLGLLLRLGYESRGVFKIPATCFFPQPDVDSACVTLARRQKPLLAPERREAFTRIVKRAFSQRRKMMFNLLKQDWPEERLAAAFGDLGMSPKARAEEIALEQFARLTERLSVP